MAKPVYLIWSAEHRAWWGPGRRGYVRGIAAAGRYSKEEMLQICIDAVPSASSIGTMAEIPVREADLRDVLSTVGYMPTCIMMGGPA